MNILPRRNCKFQNIFWTHKITSRILYRKIFISSLLKDRSKLKGNRNLNEEWRKFFCVLIHFQEIHFFVSTELFKRNCVNILHESASLKIHLLFLIYFLRYFIEISFQKLKLRSNYRTERWKKLFFEFNDNKIVRNSLYCNSYILWKRNSSFFDVFLLLSYIYYLFRINFNVDFNFNLCLRSIF